MFEVAQSQTNTAAVRNETGRLREEERSLGHGREKLPPAAGFHDRIVVAARIEAEERKLKAAPAAALAVTVAAVAAGLGEDRGDVANEVEREVLIAVANVDRDLRLESSVSNQDLGSAGPDRCDDAVRIDGGDGRLR